MENQVAVSSDPLSAPFKVLAFMEATVVNGAAKTLLNFCDTVGHSGDESGPFITVATFHRGAVTAGRPPNEFVEAVQSRGIEAAVIPERGRFDPQSIRLLRKVVAEVQPDIIQTNNVKSHALIRMTGLHRKYPWLAFHHGYTAPDLKMKLYNQLDRWSLPRADLVVAVCGPFRDQLISMGVPKQKIRVLHNSAALIPDLPSAESEEIRKSFGLSRDGTKVLLSIGRLSFEKGHADLLRALQNLRSTRPDLKWKLLVVGSGPEQKNLEELSRQLDLESQVIFASQQSNVLPFFGVADLMVLPSLTEGSPHVVLEAMSAGVPIVATAVGGVPEILTEGRTAVLVPASNPNALSAGIARVLDDPELAQLLAANAKRVLIEDFSHAAYEKSLLGLYQELLKSPNSSFVRRQA